MEKTILMLGTFASGWSGTRVYCEDLALRLQERGWRVSIASTRAGRAARVMDMAAAILRGRQAYALAHVDVYGGAAFWWAWLDTLLLRLARKPVVLSLHGGDLPRFAQRHPFAVGRMLRAVQAVTAPSAYLAGALAQMRTDIHILPNALDLSAYPFRLRQQPQPRLVWLRGFHQVYDPGMAVRVLAHLRQAVPDARLTMIGPDKGDGSLREAQELAGQLGVRQAVTFLGAISKERVPGVLEQGDIFLNTSTVDNTPVTILEAMACGLCVASTNVGGIAHLLSHQENALLSPAGDPQAMAENVCAILTQRGLAAQLSHNARLLAVQMGWPGVLDRWDALLTGILEQP